MSTPTSTSPSIPSSNLPPKIASGGGWALGLLSLFCVILLAIVAVQGVILYKMNRQHHHAWRHDVALLNSPAKIASQPSGLSAGPDAWIGAAPGWNNTSAAHNTIDPWDQIEQLHNRMDQLFAQTFDPSQSGVPMNDTFGFTVPEMDLHNDRDHYTVRMDMPGAGKDTIKVNVEGRLLSVSGQRDSTNETKNGNDVLRSERSTAEFERTITLPTPVNAATTQATYANGVLTITLPKANETTDATSVPVR